MSRWLLYPCAAWEASCHTCVLSRSVASDSCIPMDGSLPGFSVHGIFPARILEWFAFSSLLQRIFPAQYWTCISSVSCIAGGFFTWWAIGEDLVCCKVSLVSKNHGLIIYVTIIYHIGFLLCRNFWKESQTELKNKNKNTPFRAGRVMPRTYEIEVNSSLNKVPNIPWNFWPVSEGALLIYLIKLLGTWGFLISGGADREKG